MDYRKQEERGSLTFAITGSEKRGDEGAPLFTVRVDDVVRLHLPLPKLPHSPVIWLQPHPEQEELSKWVLLLQRP
jgi:hypothetical protein